MEPELLWPQTGAKAQICRKELECFAQVSPSRVRHASMFHSMTKELPRCLRSNREAMRICIRICPPPPCVLGRPSASCSKSFLSKGLSGTAQRLGLSTGISARSRLPQQALLPNVNSLSSVVGS